MSQSQVEQNCEWIFVTTVVSISLQFDMKIAQIYEIDDILHKCKQWCFWRLAVQSKLKMTHQLNSFIGWFGINNMCLNKKELTHAKIPPELVWFGIVIETMCCLSGSDHFCRPICLSLFCLVLAPVRTNHDENNKQQRWDDTLERFEILSKQNTCPIPVLA